MDRRYFRIGERIVGVCGINTWKYFDVLFTVTMELMGLLIQEFAFGSTQFITLK
jgi:hypothetical protein